MSYATQLADITRQKITLVEIDLDYCSLTWNVAPCNPAPGSVECYNTYRTCNDAGDEFGTPPKGHYDHITKTYQFTNDDQPPPFYGPKPYLRSYQLLPQEIKDNIVVKNRITIEMTDDHGESDIDTDPYWSTRGHSGVTVNGSYFKRLFARNPNYKHKAVRIYEGFTGLAFVDYKLRFTGKLENIKYEQGLLKIECIDGFKFLDSSVINPKLVGQLAVAINHTQTTGISVTSTSGMASSGEILVDDEIIHYQSLSGTTLVTVTRGYFGTLVSSHKQGSEISRVYKYTGNPFSVLRDILTDAGVSYDNTGFTEIIGYQAWTNEPNCLAVIIDEVKRSDLYWELIDQLGCKSWIDENGLIQIRRNIFYAPWPSLPSYLSSQVTITDAENIIDKSTAIDLDEKTRYTTIYFYSNIKIYNAKRVLSAAINSTVTTISVSSVEDLPATGEVVIGSEFILYNGINTSTLQLTGCTRGNRGSTAAAHSSGDPVYQGDVSALKAVNETKSYLGVTVTTDDEALNEYGAATSKIIKSRYFNSFAQYAPSFYTVSTYGTYITALSTKLLASLRDAKNKYAFQLEIKDEALKLGDFHLLTTDDFNEPDTTNYAARQFQVVKKEISEGNKIKYISEKVISYD